VGGGGGVDGFEGVDMTTAKKIKTVAAVFELLLESSRYEVYEKMREVYRPKGLLA
jgi:hypothetical protein